MSRRNLRLISCLVNSSIYIYCLEFLSHRFKEIFYVNTKSKENQSWNKNKDIYIFVFFFWWWCRDDIDDVFNIIWYWWYWWCFLCRVKILYQQTLTFRSFMNIFRSSRLQMFFEIAALKNIVIFWIKKSLQHSCFPMNIAKSLRTAFLQNISGDCFSIFLKIIKELHRKGVNINRFLKKCPCYVAK